MTTREVFWIPAFAGMTRSRVGYALRTILAWPYSTFHQFVRAGIYPVDWDGVNTTTEEEAQFGE